MRCASVGALVHFPPRSAYYHPQRFARMLIDLTSGVIGKEESRTAAAGEGR